MQFICLDFLGSAQKAAPLNEVMKKAGIDEALEALGSAFPEYNFKVVAPDSE